MVGWTKFFFVLLFFTAIISSYLVASSEKQNPFSTSALERPSPGDWVAEEDILVQSDKVTLYISNASWATFTNTNSMDPLLDETSHAIEVKPSSADQISIGDIVSYKSSKGVIIHRVIARGEDEKGMYYVVKGDNNQFQDALKVRFDDIVGVLVAVIY